MAHGGVKGSVYGSLPLRVVLAWAVMLAAMISLGTQDASSQELHKGLVPKIQVRKGAPIYIEADSLTYERDKDTYIAEGNVEITSGDLILRADKVTLDNRTRTATAEGSVRVRQKDAYVDASSIQLNVDELTGSMQEATLFFPRSSLTVRGRRIKRLSKDHYWIEGASFTTCSGDRPDWRFTAKQVDLKVEGNARARGAAFRIRGVPVLYLPYLQWPASTKRKSGFLPPDFRSSDRLGYGFSLPYYWAFHPSWDATFYFNYYTKRGYQQEVEVRYAPTKWLEGSIRGGYIRDQQDPDPSIIYRGGSPRTRADRWRIQAEQAAHLPMGFVSRLKADVVSDNYFLEDFSERSRERFERYLTSTLNLTKKKDSILFAAEAEYYRDLTAPGDDNGRTFQRLPSMLFYREGIPFIGIPVNLGWEMRFENLWRERGFTSRVLVFQPRASMPLALGRYLSVVPFAGWREMEAFGEGDGFEGHPPREGTYNYGVEMSTEVARLYDLGGTRWRAFRHTLVPKIRVEAWGRSSDGDIPVPIGQYVPHDRRVTFSLSQFFTALFMAEGGNPRYKELGRLSLIQPLSLRELERDHDGLRSERRPWLPFEWDMEVRWLAKGRERRASGIKTGPWEEPQAGLFFSFRGKWDWYDDQLNDLTATLRGADNRGDRLELRYRRKYGRPRRGREVWAALTVRTLPVLDLTAYGRYDEERSDWIRYGYSFKLQPGCWAIQFRHSIEPGYAGRETDQSFYFKIFLLGIGEVAKF